MPVYGFNEKDVAKRLRDLARRSKGTEGNVSEKGLINEAFTNARAFEKGELDIYFGTIDTTITAATYEDVTDPEVGGTKGKIKLGTGSATIHHRDTVNASNPPSDDEYLHTIPSRQNVHDDWTPDPSTYEITVYNFYTQEFTAVTNADEFESTDPSPSIFIRDRYGDFYIVSPDELAIFTGRATAANEGTSPFNIDNITRYLGPDPRTNKTSNTEVISVINLFTQTCEDNDLWIVIRDRDGNYQAIRPGEGTGQHIYRFRLTADLTLSATSGDAEVVDDAGAAVSPQQLIKVVDTEAMWRGYATYTQATGGTVDGFNGYALKFTDDYAGSGKSGAHIIWMEQLAEVLIVEIVEDVIGLGYKADITPASMVLGNAHGARQPKQASGAYNLDVHKNAGVDAFQDEIWEVGYDLVNDRYELKAPVLIHDRIRGDIVGDVTGSDATHTVDGITEVKGLVPTTSPLTFTCTPRLDAVDNQNIELDFNRNDGLWYPVSEYNSVWVLRGLPNFDSAENNLLGWKVSGGEAKPEWDTIVEWLKLLDGWGASNDQSIGHDTSGDPEWQDDTDC